MPKKSKTYCSRGNANCCWIENLAIDQSQFGVPRLFPIIASMNKLGIITLGLAIFCLASCNNSGSDDSKKTLMVGMELAYPPFEMRNTSNQPDGISVRMAEDLGEYLGQPVEIRDVAWDGIIPALKSGNIDLIISSMTKTEQRAKSIDFSDGYVTNGLCLLVAKDSAIKSAKDLEKPGTRIAVKLATTGELWAKEHLKEAKFTTLDASATCVLEVIQGRADAFIYDQISIYRHWQKNLETTQPILNPIREETWGIGIRKGEDELKQKVNAFLKDYREKGGFEKLADQYMAKEKAAFEELGVPFVFH